MPVELFAFLFFIVAFIYSMVGFAGGSSYLLVLTLAGFTHTQSAPIALVCNLVVSGAVFGNFYKAGHFRLRTVLPFLILSVPMAFVGAGTEILKQMFFILLGVCLALAGLRLLFLKKDAAPVFTPNRRIWSWGLPAGAVMGFFSGLVGIGGGIFLSPFLILMRLASFKEASAAASFFIFINSLTGLAGRIQNGFEPDSVTGLLALSALAGGWIGSRLACGRQAVHGLQRVLAALILFISMNLVLKAF